MILVGFRFDFDLILIWLDFALIRLDLGWIRLDFGWIRLDFGWIRLDFGSIRVLVALTALSGGPRKLDDRFWGGNLLASWPFITS